MPMHDDILDRDLEEEDILSKECFPTSLKSDDIRRLWSRAVKEQSIFSARTSSRTYLERVRELLAAYQTGIGKTATGDVISQGRERTRMLMREKLEELGLIERNNDGSIEERLTNLGSTARLELIIDTNTSYSHSTAQKMAQSDPLQQILRPAWELVRNRMSRQERNWWDRWVTAAENVGWEGVAPMGSGRMVALVESPVWSAIGNIFPDSIGVDQPPFCYGSGMGWKSITREECIRIGLIEPDEHDEV